MKSKHFLQLIMVSFFSLFLSSNSFAAYTNVPSAEAKSWAEKVGRNLIDILSEQNSQEKFDKLDSLLLNNVDMDYIAKFVMGRHWRTMSEAQKKEYLPLFKRYSMSLYKSFPLQFDKGKVKYSIKNVRVEKGYSLAFAEVIVALNNDQPLNIIVEFRLHKNNGKIMITDFKVAETSFLIVYRNRFAEILQADDNDITWFLEDLTDIVNSAEINNRNMLPN